VAVQVVEQDGVRGYRIFVGGGLGRTPMIGKVLRDFLPEADLLPYVEAVVSVWNLLGRRDNKYKARIKITVHEHGIEEISRLVDARFADIRPTFSGVDQVLLREIEAHFATPAYMAAGTGAFDAHKAANPAFRSWADTNLAAHKNPDYAIVSISLKAHGETPGDASADQMRLMAELAEKYGHDELRISHEQNVIIPHVHKSNLPDMYQQLRTAGLGTANIGLVSDIIACPGMDYCALATARSIPVAQQIALRFEELKLEHEVGPLKLKISGCINACGHHHVGHIGILGLDRAGVENYQITLGGDATEDAAIGERAGPGFSADDIVPAIERLVLGYLDIRHDADETFIQAYRRLGAQPFKDILYPEKAAQNAA
jgi:sulfite reductase (NADPH) hemoprotein beta-component